MEQVYLESFDTIPLANVQEQNGSESSKKKRPPNAFIRFCLENRKPCRDNHPEMTNIEISSLLATEWNKLTEEQKNPYKLLAQEEQKKFKEENPQYGYDKAKQKRCLKKTNDFPKQLYDIPDIFTLVALPPEELRHCLNTFQNHLFLQFLNLQNLDQEADSSILDNITHTFQNQQ
ncbi:hypothetical protein M9Y10_044318 [Tritrichomonas musculus]|uniref:HMG box domain-containing protein n=1 Tax=Tritrichomonas musculus TaxID=1915356 RepID=A0ABR2K286_9EUKA